MAFQIKKKKQKVKKVDQLFYIGQQHHTQGDLQQAELFYNQVLLVNPNHSNTLQALGVIRFQTRRFQEAIALINQSLSINPNCAEAHNNLGNIFEELDRFEDAKNHYDVALSINPKLVNAHYNLGNLFKRLCQFDKVKDCYQLALDIDPSFEDAYNGLGVTLVAEGKIDEGLEYYRKLLKINPNYVIAYDNLLMALNYHSNLTSEEVYKEHLEYGNRYGFPFKSFIQPHTNSLISNRPIRIGYVSGDFLHHSVAYFLEPVFKFYNKQKFEVFCYSNIPQGDNVTELLKASVNNWIDIYGMSDEQVANQIRKDGIDVLVDLGGHTAGNKLLVFARKPAPIQVSWLGYPNTTGLDTIDYRIVDKYTDPEGVTDKFYTEKLIRMPECFSCFKPMTDIVEVNELPSLKNGYITFGSFNNVSKITPGVLELWSKIILTVPNSKLMLKYDILLADSVKKRVYDLFEQYGVSRERVDLVGHMASYEDHLKCYNNIDIALDPFPYNGTTTSCEALYMGVPVITLEGDRHVSRTTSSQLHNIGLSEFIATTKDEYVNIAELMSHKVEFLNTLRLQLRERVKFSPLMDGERFTKNLEIVYQDMWKKYVGENRLTHIPKNNKLHIGGKYRTEGWDVLNATSADYVDYIGNANDLSFFASETFEALYSSHVVEHLDYTGELLTTLKEWNRVLKPGGKIYISVPDLEILARLYLDKKQFGFEERWDIMRMIFGGHSDQYDYHVVGLNEELLSEYLYGAGFINIKRVDNFNLFQDTSSLDYYGTPISLNLIAEKVR